jgi:hypothetical protein
MTCAEGLPMDTTSDGTLADPQEVIADLRRKLAEAEAREAAIAEVLQVINSSPLRPCSRFRRDAQKGNGPVWRLAWDNVGG